jgi:two-component system, sensor histidine kinase LadS
MAALLVAPSLTLADPLALSDDTLAAPLAPHCDLARDRDGHLDARAVLALPAAPPLRRVGVDVGFTTDTIWLRCRVRNAATARGEWLVDVGGHLDRVEVYTALEGALRVARGGRLQPFVDLEVPYPSFVARLRVDGGAEAPLLLRIRSDAPVVLRPRVWAAHAFVDHVFREVLVMGLFYGLLLVALAYNVSLYVSTRQRIYRLYGAFVGAVLLFSAVIDQLVAALVTPRDAAWQATSAVRFGALATLAAIAFARAYLDTPRLIPKADRAARPVELALLALFATTFVSNAVIFKKATMLVAAPALIALFVAALGAEGAATRRGSSSRGRRRRSGIWCAARCRWARSRRTRSPRTRGARAWSST